MDNLLARCEAEYSPGVSGTNPLYSAVCELRSEISGSHVKCNPLNVRDSNAQLTILFLEKTCNGEFYQAYMWKKHKVSRRQTWSTEDG